MTPAFYERFKPLLLQQYKDAENLNLILEVLSSPFEDLEIVFAGIKNVLNLDNAEGVVLDLIGDIIGQKREGMIDADYLIQIKFKIFKNTSRGFVADVVKALKFITQATKVIYSDNTPASYTIYTNGQNVPNDIKTIIDKLSAAGISLIVYASIGETPFIATDIAITNYNLIDDGSNNLIDDGTNQIQVSSQSTDNKTLQQIFNGGDFGTVQSFYLTTDTLDTIILDTTDSLIVTDPDQAVVGSAKANLVYQ